MSSKLAAIISRLDSMTADTEEDQASRRFEKNGQQVAIVTYNQETRTFNLAEVKSQQEFEFDDIDLVAIEIYDLLTD
ncbi:MAG: YkuJ family protein [Liquorilactobacillus ghanensis]|uniref:DUF1797 domain-containing protein n=2 Tax=Liquorilactobacillus ghanensis TaxID=399370 RepID=A0A0R1VLT1_9LACO|nr:YkuJ family protein [Liquorilactobacillus ghanensis]KRM06784.1 hypothetical protein FC89_GL000483 [Liquorilactobacillus ghanensis DSM 18630]